MRPRALLGLLCLLVLCSGAGAQYRLSITDAGGRNPEIYPDYHSALLAIPSGDRAIISADMILSKAKLVENGALAGLELQINQRCQAIPNGKREHLNRLYQALKVSEHPDPELRYRAEGYVAAALAVQGLAPRGPNPRAEEIMQAVVRRFEQDPILPHPFGFIGLDDQLGSIFRQDRVAQTRLIVMPGANVLIPELGETPAEQFALAKFISDTILRDDELRAEHLALMSLYAVIYGPRHVLTVEDMDGVMDLAQLQESEPYALAYRGSGEQGVAWELLPHPMGPWDALRLRLVSDGGPDAPTTLREAAEAVASGSRTLYPRTGGGFTDLLQHSQQPMLTLEPLVVDLPLELGDSYASRLGLAFASELTQERAHRRRAPVKRGDDATGSASGRRAFLIEPLPEIYVRRAEAVRALRQGLDVALGEGTPRFVKGLRAGGERQPMSIAVELADLERQLTGCYALACADLGVTPDAGRTSFSSDELSALADEAYQWLSEYASEPDFSRDIREMVPVHRRVDQRYRVWMVAGVQLVRMEILPETGDPIHAWMGVERVLEGLRADLPPWGETIASKLGDTARLGRARKLAGAPSPFRLGRLFGQLCLYMVIVVVAILAIGVLWRSFARRASAPPTMGRPGTRYATRRRRRS